MSIAIDGIALWLVVIWPLLLAFPGLGSRVYWPRHLAVLPAAVLIMLPGDFSLQLPWLLFGTGFAVDDEVRWLLATAVAIWLTAATVVKSPPGGPANDRTTTFFLLTLAGNLGAVLATDLVGFFSLSTLMGYGFYGLLIHGGDEAVRRAARLYLICLIVADLALFEALLLIAYRTEDLQFATAHQAIAIMPSSQVYLLMVLAGFMLKAGTWPVHIWLSVVFKSAPLSTTILVGGVPVATGLLGIVRWLPVGEHTFYVVGTALQIIGLMAILYAALRSFTHTPAKVLPVWGTVAFSALFVAALGKGLAHPAVWGHYGYLAYPFIAALGLFSAALALVFRRRGNAGQSRNGTQQQVGALTLRARHYIVAARQYANRRSSGLRTLLGGRWRKALRRYQTATDWQMPGVFDGGWRAAITMFVLLGLAVAGLAI